MKVVGVLLSSLFLFVSSAACAQDSPQDSQDTPQQLACTPKPIVDWTQLNPALLDEAFDLLEDLSLQADALDKSDEVYAPREADSEKLAGKIRRQKSSDADEEAFCPLAVYKFAIDMRRITNSMGPGACSSDQSNLLCHPMADISAKRQKAEARLAEIQNLYKQATQKAPEPSPKKKTTATK